MSIILRKAEKEDCVQLMELIQELAIYEKEPNAVTVSMEEFVQAGFGENPVWGAFVAEQDGKIIGMALYYIRYSTWKGCRLYLEDLIVKEEFRGQGIGKLLLDQTISFAKDQNYSGMMWQVLNWNEPAIKFYEKYEVNFDAGWVNVNLNFRD